MRRGERRSPNANGTCIPGFGLRKIEAPHPFRNSTGPPVSVPSTSPRNVRRINVPSRLESTSSQEAGFTVRTEPPASLSCRFPENPVTNTAPGVNS